MGHKNSISVNLLNVFLANQGAFIEDFQVVPWRVSLMVKAQDILILGVGVRVLHPLLQRSSQMGIAAVLYCGVLF